MRTLESISASPEAAADLKKVLGEGGWARLDAVFRPIRNDVRMRRHDQIILTVPVGLSVYRVLRVSLHEMQEKL